MNSKSVLDKILTLLSLSEDVNFTDAQTQDGTILQSPTFDLNEDVEVVHEDGTKTPAADGEYTISLKDESGNENIIRIEVKDGKIVERANEEEEKNEDEQEMSDAGTAQDPTKGDSENRIDVNSVPGGKIATVIESNVKMGAEFPAAPKGASMEPAHALPNTTDEDPRNRIGPDTDDNKDPIISLSYRIDELEKHLAAIKQKFDEMNPPMEEAMEETAEAIAPSANLPVGGPTMTTMSEIEEELPKLDGAPTETALKFSSDQVLRPNNFGKRSADSQSNFLSKLYS